jgi:hypothetical protein
MNTEVEDEIRGLSLVDLKKLLLTVDGRGKDVKEIVLSELLDRVNARALFEEML